MTRKEEIARAAKDYHIKQHPNFSFKEYVAFIDGAMWADSTMIDKACEWLKNANAAHAIVIRKGVYNMKEFSVIEFTDSFVEQFRQAMKGD